MRVHLFRVAMVTGVVWRIPLSSLGPVLPDLLPLLLMLLDDADVTRFKVPALRALVAVLRMTPGSELAWFAPLLHQAVMRCLSHREADLLAPLMQCIVHLAITQCRPPALALLEVRLSFDPPR